MTKNPWFVWCPEGPRQPSVFHSSFESARNEASRMARIHPGKPFHVCKISGTAIKRDVDWIPGGEADDEIPF